MPDLTIAPDPTPSRRAATREYLLDMLEQLAKLARGSGELHIAILLDAALAADRVAERPN